MPVKIVIADDHDVVRQGLRTILRAHAEWEICAEAANGEEAVAAVRSTNPDIVVLDITMPVMSGLDALQHITRLNVPARVLIFTMHDSSSLVKAVRDAGAKGYVLKSHAARDLVKAIEALLGGETFFGTEGGGHASEDRTDKGLTLLAAQQLRTSF